jgi:hypothetical protein
MGLLQLQRQVDGIRQPIGEQGRDLAANLIGKKNAGLVHDGFS